jgi:hypothetical protein
MITVTVSQAALQFPPAAYTASIVVINESGPNPTPSQTINVTFTVTSNALNIIPRMVFGALFGAPGAQSSQTLAIGAGASVPFTYTIQPAATVTAASVCVNSSIATSGVTGTPWLSVNGSTGGSGTAPQNLAVSIQPAGLAPGTYRDDIFILAGGATYDVAVYLVVSGTATTPVSFTYTIGGALPAPQVFSAGSTCEPIPAPFPNTLSINAGSDQGWLSASPSVAALPNASFTVSANPGSLPPGTYTGTVVTTDEAGEVAIYSSKLIVSGSPSKLSALPHFAAQDVWTTGILVINTEAAPANYSVSFYQDNGSPITLPFSPPAHTISGTLQALGSAYYETTNPAGAPLIEGWGQITADAPIVIQALFREHSSGTYYEAAVPSNAGSQEFEIPFDATTFAATGAPFYTGFAIANLDPSNTATIICTARDPNGNVIPGAFTNLTGPPQLPPLGHWAGYLFPQLAGQRGTIDCISNTDIAAVALRFIGNNAFSSLAVIDKGGITPTATQNSALPHFAAQDVWTTGIFVVNTAAAPANFSIAFHQDNGSPISLPFSPPANTLSGKLPALGSAYYETTNPAGAPLIEGWGQITADPSIVIQALFRENSTGTYYEAAVPSNAGSMEFEIPFDATTFGATGAPFFTGFAIANLDPVNTATVTCTARDSNGNVIPNAFTAATGPPQLNPLGHWAGYLFPALSGIRGTIDCVSNTNIAAIALRFIGNNAFSSLSVTDK